MDPHITPIAQQELVPFLTQLRTADIAHILDDFVLRRRRRRRRRFRGRRRRRHALHG